MSEEFDRVISEIEQISEDAQNTFGSYSAAQINWKPSATEWSVGQCFDHLIKINSAYFPEFESLVKGERKPKFWENYSPLSGFFGNLLYKNLSPKATRKLKAPRLAEPSVSEVVPSIIEDFAQHQTELVDKIRQTANFEPKKIILTSPFAKFITYSFFDAYRIIATHERRHFEQAERIAKLENFPK